MTKTRKLTTMAMLIALAVGLAFAVHFPIMPAVPFLEYDPATIPMLIGTFAFGPLAGLIITIITAVIQGLTVSASSGWYGIIMHIIGTGSFVIVAGLIYKARKTRKRAAIGMGIATLTSVLIMIGANMVITPIFTGMPTSAVWKLMFVGIVPFNLIKFLANGIVTFLIYKPISNLIKLPIEERAADKSEA